MYHPANIFIAIFTLVLSLRVLAQTPATLAYDTNYDNGNLSLDRVACSNGVNGLETKGYTTLGSLSNFPNVGGVYTVSGWDSPYCGACYAVTYGNGTVNILAVDVSKTGFTVSEAAMNNLTEGQAVGLGRIDVTYVEVNQTSCGL